MTEGNQLSKVYPLLLLYHVPKINTLYSTTIFWTPLAVLELKGMPGSQAFGMDFDTGTRISESYAKAGKELAKYFEKSAK